MEVATDHLSTGLKQSVHHVHKSIYIVKIVKYTAFHKYHIKETGILVHIDFHDIANFITYVYTCSFSCFHGIFLIGFGNIKYCNLCSQKG